MLPSNSILKRQCADYAYRDTFEVAISRQDVANWEMIAALFRSAPPWFDVLTKFRDRMVSIFGLKTSVGDPKRLAPRPPHPLRCIAAGWCGSRVVHPLIAEAILMSLVIYILKGQFFSIVGKFIE